MSCRDYEDDGPKTLIAFMVGLLIGGMLLWAFSSPLPESVEQQAQATGEAIFKDLTPEQICAAKGGVPIMEQEGNQLLLKDCKGI